MMLQILDKSLMLLLEPYERKHSKCLQKILMRCLVIRKKTLESLAEHLRKLVAKDLKENDVKQSHRPKLKTLLLNFAPIRKFRRSRLRGFEAFEVVASNQVYGSKVV